MYNIKIQLLYCITFQGSLVLVCVYACVCVLVCVCMLVCVCACVHVQMHGILIIRVFSYGLSWLYRYSIPRNSFNIAGLHSYTGEL